MTNAQNDLLQFLWTGTNSLHLSREITVKNSLWTKLNLFSLHYFITSSCSKHTRCIACLRRLQLTFIWPVNSGSRGLMDRRNKFRQTIKFVRMSKCLSHAKQSYGEIHQHGHLSAFCPMKGLLSTKELTADCIYSNTAIILEVEKWLWYI